MYQRNYSIFENMDPDEIQRYLEAHVDDPTTRCENGMKYLQESGVSMVPEVRSFDKIEYQINKKVR